MTAQRALDEDLDLLFSASPEDFTGLRNDIVKRLRDAGEDEAAKRVKALRRPSLPVWALNQVARIDRDGIAGLLESQEAMGAIADVDRLRELSKKRRQLVARLTDSASSVLEESGRNASSQTLEKVRNTLLAATSPEEAELLRTGRLQTELQSHGFDGMLGAESLPEVEADDDSPARRKKVAKAEELDEKAGEAVREAAELRRVAEGLKREAKRTQAAARAADDKASAAEAAARRAEDAAKKARQKL
jgi:hypothetical protein